MSQAGAPRIGFGYDVHRLVEGRPLVIGGVTIPHERGLAGHSDADVLLHAVADALLGAAALGDIGAHFPDTDPTWEGADSLELLAAVGEKVRNAGYRLANVDATVVLERPKLRPHIDTMRARTAEALDAEVGQVSIKATTSEGIGFVGGEEGAAAYAVCALTSISEEAKETEAKDKATDAA
jgi:2-C-methyl-D-erythritol 2,4-cyclodiphosphate synthase